MKNITSFTKSSLEVVRTEIESKLAELKALGLHIEMGSMSFDAKSFSAKIKCQLVQEGEEAKPEHVINWEKGYYHRHGFSKDDLGKEISLRGEQFEIVGCSTRASKNGVRISKVGSSDKEVYTFNTNEAIRLLRS